MPGVIFTSLSFNRVIKWDNLSDYLAVFMAKPSDPYRKFREGRTEFVWGDNGYRVVECRDNRIYHTWHPAEEFIPEQYNCEPWLSVIKKNHTKTIVPKSYRNTKPKGMLGLIDMIQYIESISNVPLNQFIGCEIGTYQGSAADIFARKFQRIWTVDPWIRGDHIMETVRGIYYENMAEHKNFTHMQVSGDEAVGGIYDSMLDFIYIDADHSYPAVVSDIKAWKPKLKPDGFLCGHDFPGRKGDVERALLDTIGKPDRVFNDSSWVVQYREGVRI